MLGSFVFHELAHADDQVAVVFVGPNKRAPLYDLSFNEDETVRTFSPGERPLIAASGGGVSFTDIRILPSGAALLADAGQRGFVVTDRFGELLFVMDATRGTPLIASAVVASFIDEERPAQVLLTDNSTARVFLYDVVEERPVWNQAFTVSSYPGRLSAAIWMPEERVAVAVNWPSLGLHAVDVLPIGAHEGQRPLRYTNQSHSDGPADQIVIEELEAVRDIMAFGDGNLLITSRFRLMAIDAGGEVLWTVDSGLLPEVHGEFASARWLPSGRLALATFEPGMWTYPHTNHRVHWFEVDDGEPRWIAKTPILDAAPSRIDAAGGHGATGTLNYRADLDGERGSAEDLVVVDHLSLDSVQYRLGDAVEVGAMLRNDGPTALRLGRLQVSVSPDPSDGRCDELEENASGFLWRRAPLLIEAGGLFILRSSGRLESPLGQGHWCARLISTDDQMIQRIHGRAVAFKITGSGSASTIEVRDLGGTIDAGDGGDTDHPIDSLDEPEGGCVCSALAPYPTSPGPGWALFFLVAAFLVRTRRRQRRPR
ncbi:MAG: hypothetical protein ACNA8W_03605 [Bradymonadaceae bacterium]